MTIMSLLSLALSAFTLLLLARAVLSWLPNKTGALGSFNDFVVTLTEPVLAPVRRHVPPVGGFDISFLVVIVAIMVVRAVLFGA